MALAPFEPGAAERPSSRVIASTLSAGIVAFCAWLRNHADFLIGPAEERDALRAAEIIGVEHPQRLRRALRLVLCSKHDELAVFDQAFTAFFLDRRPGRPQPSYAPRHTRERSKSEDSVQKAGDHAGRASEAKHATGDAPSRRGEPIFGSTAPATKEHWQTLLARYSAQAARAEVPAIAARDVRQYLQTADRLVRSVHLGHVRRWRPQASGHRFDIRRTLRASLHTGGDPVALRFLGHPLRNPRFILLIDGSRSMATYGSVMLEFGYALVRRSRRAHVFLFSTALCDITSQLRRAAPFGEHRVTGVDDAWGGGTRIGESVHRFVDQWGSRCLNDETVVIIYSDGFDVGDVDRLGRAMREIQRRCACVIWVNPLANTPGYAPAAKGMRAALPSIDALIGVRQGSDLAGLARVAAQATR